MAVHPIPEGYHSVTPYLVVGHVWSVATHKEDVSPEEMRRRSQAMMTQQAGG